MSETPQECRHCGARLISSPCCGRVLGLEAERDALRISADASEKTNETNYAEVERLRAQQIDGEFVCINAARAEKAEAALRVHSAEMLRVEREWADRLSSMGEIIKRVAAQPCEQFTDGVRNCENTGSAPCLPCSARAALRDIDRKRMPGR